MLSAILTPNQRLLARQLYQERKIRIVDPDGTFDNAKRFYPSATEMQPCCKFIRRPTRAWPYSLMLHCRTLRHCQALIHAGWLPSETTRIMVSTLTPPDTPFEEWVTGVDKLLADLQEAPA